MIPKSELEDGQWYYKDFRNSYLGNGLSLFVPLRKANDEELESIKKIENESIL